MCTDVQQRNGCNCHPLVFTTHFGYAGVPREFHRSSLELGKGIVPETLIVLPVRERNEQARST